MIHPRETPLLPPINRRNSRRTARRKVEQPAAAEISGRSHTQATGTRMVPNKRVKSVTTLGIRKTPGRSEPLENRVPLFRASRPGGYEKYEIWFSRILNGVQAVSLPHSRSRAIVAPHAYRGRISGPGSPFVSLAAGHCPLRKRPNRS